MASSQRWPALEVEAGLRTSPEGEAFDLGVRMGVPLWNRGAEEIKAARADRAIQGYRQEAARRDLQSERVTALARRKAAIESLALFRDQVVPDTEASLMAARRVFDSGDSSLTDVLQISQEWVIAKERLLEWTVALAEAEAELVRLR